MRRPEKIELAPVFGEKAGRKATPIKAAELKGRNQDFESYTAQEGDIFVFPTLESAEIKEQPIAVGSKNKVVLLACVRVRNNSERPSWFNINSLGKRDVDNVKQHELFMDCADAYDRVVKLCELGAIKAVSTKEIAVPLFEEKPDANGKPVRKYKMETDGDGVEVKVFVNGTQTIPVFEQYELED
jgi:hypothetical protein